MLGEVSPFKPDVDYVLRDQSYANIRIDRWSCWVTARGKPIRVLKVMNVDVQEYYESNYGAVKTIDIVMGAGEYAHHLYPNRDDLSVQLMRQDAYQANMGYEGELTGVMENEFYIGKLITQENESLENYRRGYADAFSMDLEALKVVQLQLISKVEMQVRSAQVGGIYRDTTVGEVIRTIMTGTLKSLQATAEELPKGIDLTPPDNNTVYEQIIIPDGTALIDVPGLLQSEYGVYSTGLSHYIRDGMWYVFPTYNVERGSKAKYTLQISVVSARHYPTLGKTYRTAGGSTLVIANGARELIDMSEALLNNEGNGAKYLSADAIANPSVDVDSEPNKAIYDPSQATSDYVAYKSPTGIDNVPLNATPITSNQYRVLSELALRSGAFFTLVWNFSDPKIARPGTVATIRYAEGSEIRELEGVLVQAVHSGKLYEPGFTSIDYANQSVLCFFIQRDLGFLRNQESQPT